MVAQYPSIERFSHDVGLSADILVRSFALEKAFHHDMRTEADPARRRVMYNELYTRVFEIYGAEFRINLEAEAGPKDAMVEMLRPELQGRAILDIGCGAGEFLLSCARKVEPSRLLGIDVFAKDMDVGERHLRFRRADVIRFDLGERFDVVVTDNVMEHIAPQDVEDHLASIHNALEPGGLLMIFTPNRHFGPWDVTRILDDTYAGNVPAQGSHLHEYTHAELAETLTHAGFVDLHAIHPKARIGLRPAQRRTGIEPLLRGERQAALMRRLKTVDKRFRLQAFEIAMFARKAFAA